MSAGSVAVVIPTFNRPALLAEAVESVLAQSHPVRELVIVDDGSAPVHQAGLDRIAGLDPRIQWVVLPGNRGRSAARNTGLAHVRAEFVIFLDDDDLLDRDTVALSLRCFRTAPGADIVVSRGLFFGLPTPASTRLRWFRGGHQPPTEWLGAWSVRSRSAMRNLERDRVRTFLTYCPPIHGCMIRTAALGAIRFAEDLDCGEDWLFWLDLALQGVQFRFNPHGLVYVRRHAGNGHGSTDNCNAACERALRRVQGQGRRLEFLADALRAREYLKQQNPEWRRIAFRLALSPDHLLQYGFTVLVRHAYDRWLPQSGVAVSRP